MTGGLFSRFHVVANPENRGFAYSCNRGARIAKGKFLLLLNNDTELLPGWWQPLRNILAQRPDIGLVAPKLIFPDHTIQHCGKVWKDTGVPDCQAHHIYYRMADSTPCVNISRSYRIVTGACLLFRTEEFLRLGGFDEQYRNGWEDDDLCYTYRAAGLSAWYCAESVILHHQGATLSLQHTEPSSTPTSTTGAHNFSHNRAHFFHKWGTQVVRDDFQYYQADGFTTDPDIPRYAPDLQEYLGKPFERASDNATPATGTQKSPLVSIVILAWNQLEYTRQCLASIERHTPEAHEIICVDNGSTDGTRSWLREQATRQANLTIITNRENRGFARGCNQGIETAKGELILLLNNDVIVTPHWLSGLIDCLLLHSHSGIVGPLTNSISGVQQLPSIGYTDLAALEDFAIDYREKYRHRRIPQRRIVGFCMLFRRSLVDQIGLLDERFGSGNFEDDDFCIRAALAGYTNLIAGDVFIHHFGSATFRGNGLDYATSITGNHNLFREKWAVPTTDKELLRQIVVLKTLEKSETLYQRGNTEEAFQTLLLEGMAQVPGEPRLFIVMATWLLEQERYQDAEGVIRQMPPDTTWSREQQTLLATALTEQNNLEIAEQIVENLLQQSPEYAPAWNIKGVIALKRRDNTVASTCFNRAIAADGGYAPPWPHLALLARENNDPDQALLLAERGMILSPTSRFCCTTFHWFCGEASEPDYGISLFREILHFYPSLRAGRFLLIDRLIATGSTELALAEIEQTMLICGLDKGMITPALVLRKSIGPLTIPPGTRDTLSVCLIVKDEEQHLVRCLSSLKSLADELIVIDTGSTDTTREIATIFGAQVYEFPWNGDFSAARNESLLHATGDWILVMDADEAIAPVDHHRIREHLVGSQPPIARELVSRNYHDNVSLENWQPNRGEYPGYEAGGGWVGSTKVRLFPNRYGIFFEKPVHELVDYGVRACGLRIEESPVPIHHYGYLDKERLRIKRENYYRLGKIKLAEAGGSDLKALTELAIQAGELGHHEEAIDLWNQALAVNSQHLLALFNLGHAYLHTGQFKKSLEVSRQALQIKPDHIEAALNGAMAALCGGWEQEASVLLTPFMAQQEERPNLALVIAMLALFTGNRQQALTTIQRLAINGIVMHAFINEFMEKLCEAGESGRATLVGELAVETGIATTKTTELLRTTRERR